MSIHDIHQTTCSESQRVTASMAILKSLIPSQGFVDHPGNPVEPFPVDSLWVLFHSSRRYGQGVCIDRLDRRSGRTSDIHQTLHSDLMNFGPSQCQEYKHYTIDIVYHMYMYIYRLYTLCKPYTYIPYIYFIISYIPTLLQLCAKQATSFPAWSSFWI